MKSGLASKMAWCFEVQQETRSIESGSVLEGGNQCTTCVENSRQNQSAKRSQVIRPASGFSPDVYHYFIDSMIAGTRSATVVASPPMFTTDTTDNPVTFKTVSVDDVIDAINRTSHTHLQSDAALFPCNMIYQGMCFHGLCVHITRIFNLSLTGGHFLSHWMNAKTKPMK